MQTMSMSEIPEPVTQYLKKIGAKGGAKSKRTLSPEQLEKMRQARMNSPWAQQVALRRQQRIEAKAAAKEARLAKKAAKIAAKEKAKIDQRIKRLQRKYGKVLLRKDALAATLVEIETKIEEQKNA